MKRLVKYILVSLAIVLLYSCSDGLSDFQKKSFMKFYGSYQLDIGRDVQVLASGGYAITGSMIPDSISSMFLIITDEYGNQTENSPKYYGGLLQTSGSSLLALDDGFLLVGQIVDTLVDGTLQSDIYMVRTDLAGEELWSSRLGGDENETVYHVTTRSEGGYVLAGKREVNNQDDLWIVMVDEEGNKISDFIGSNGISDDEARYIHNTGNGYLVACTYDDGAFAGKDFMVVYVDENSNLFDTRAMGTNYDDFARSIIVYDGAYLLMGNSNNTTRGNSEIALYTFTLEGNLIKNQQELATIFEIGIDLTGEGCAIGSDGNIAVVGSREVNENKDILLQFIGEGGDVGEAEIFGQLGSQSGNAIKRTLDGGLILVGSNGLEGNSVISLIKTNAQGKF